MQCPYCLSMVVDLLDECPHCEAHLPVDHELEAEVNAHFDEDYGDYDMGDDPLIDDDMADDMDGDAESALASAGYGTDEDYGDYGQYDAEFDQWD
jgi:hypothetical protein